MTININDTHKIRLDKGMKIILKFFFIIACIAFIIFIVIASINISTGKHGNLWGWEYNIPNCDTLAGPNVQHEENNTQINNPDAPIRIGGHDTY